VRLPTRAADACHLWWARQPGRAGMVLCLIFSRLPPPDSGMRGSEQRIRVVGHCSAVQWWVPQFDVAAVHVVPGVSVGTGLLKPGGCGAFCRGIWLGACCGILCALIGGFCLGAVSSVWSGGEVYW
jgi:hypothetical protein